jgi:ATP-dependent helicase HrpB
VTVVISQAAAEQRAGRSGREAPGTCWRLWPEAAHRALLPFEMPEILSADLVPLALELALWGVVDAAALDWPPPPPAAALDQAR